MQINWQYSEAASFKLSFRCLISNNVGRALAIPKHAAQGEAPEKSKCRAETTVGRE